MHLHIRVVNGRVELSGPASARFGSAERKLGPWAIWQWDGAILQADVDRYGFYPIFYAVKSDEIALSDSISELLGLGFSRQFDDSAIAAFLRLGFFLGEDTPFLAIRAFPPGGRLHWDPMAGLRVTGGPIQRKPDVGISRSEAVDGFVERFRAAVAKSLPNDPDRTVLPLSGGRDSRHIALELKRLGFQPGLVITQRHFSSRSDDDAEVARQMCGALNWPIEVQSQVADPVASEIEKNRLFDCLTDEHAWFLPSARRIVETGMKHVFDGIAGDVLSKGLFVRQSWIDCGQRQAFSEWFRGMPEWGYGASEEAISHLLAPVRRIAWGWEAAFARVSTEMEKFSTDDNPINPFMFWNRSRREIAPFLVRYLPGIEVLTPYCDDEVFEFLWNLPTPLLEDQHLHDEAIARAAPVYAHIPFEGTNSAADPRGYNASLMRGMARRWPFWWGGDILDRRWLRSRLGASVVSKDFGGRTGWYASWALWLASLETLAASSG